MSRRRLLLLVVGAVLVLSACAAGTNAGVDVPDADGDVAGFFMGLWHGIILPITFVISQVSGEIPEIPVRTTP